MAEAEALQSLLDSIDRDRMIDDLCSMIAIPSINPFQGEVREQYREHEMAEYYADRMTELGLDVGRREVVPGRPNVWGILKGEADGPSLMLSGHLDTVGIENYPEALMPRVADNRVYGRGSCDMKDALASYLEIVRVLREANLRLPGDLLITGVVDEEDQLIGSQDFGRDGPWADFGIIGEPSDMMVCRAHKGQLGFRIKCRGKAVHSSRPELGVNAIEGISRVVDALGDYRDDLLARNPHALCGHARCCPSVVRGGTIVSTVPDYCELEVDRRTLPGETLESVLAELEAVVGRVRASHADFEFEIEGPTISIGALDVPGDHEGVGALLRAVERVSGKPCAAQAFFGGTDAPNFGFPMLIYGAGSIAQAHSINEYVDIDDWLTATRVYLTALVSLSPPRTLAG